MTLTTTNFDIAQLAISASDDPDRAETECAFAERYAHAAATAGREWAETLAHAEALACLLRIDRDAAAYLRPLLR